MSPILLTVAVPARCWRACSSPRVTLSWTQSKVQLRHLGVTSARAADYQRLAGMVIRADPRLRATPAQVLAGAGPQSDLWGMSI